MDTRKKRMTVGLCLLAALLAVLVALVPIEAQLGHRLKLVLFHGASTWVNLLAISAAGVLSAVFLTTRRPGACGWASAFFRVALPMWVLNGVLGVISMWLAWSKLYWQEPKMLMTLQLLVGLGAVLAVRLLAEDRRLPALADVALTGVMWWRVATVREVAHPDSPVFDSGFAIQALFLGQALAIVAFVVLLVALLRPASSEEAGRTVAADAA